MSADPYRKLFENAAIGIKWVTLDGRMVEVNRHLCDLLGYSRDELMALGYDDLTHPDDRDRDRALLERLVAGKIESYSIEKRYLRRDGSPVHVRVTSALSRVGGLHRISIVEDFGTRHAAAHAAAEAGARMRSVLALVPDGIVVIDERGIVEGFSPAAERLFGWAAAEVVGRNVSMLMPSPYREQHDGYIERFLRTGERRIIGIGRVVTGLRKDGTTFPMQLSVDEVVSEGRRLFTGLVRDLTERQQIELRVEQLQADLMHLSRLGEMGQMAAAIAHELNQPLTAIATYIRACRRILEAAGSEVPERAGEAMERAVAQTARASEVVRRLRQFVEKGKTEHRLEDINGAVEEASALALIGAREAGVVVNVNLAPEGPTAHIDRVQVQQVVVNLVRNAVEAMEVSPQRILSIRTMVEEATVRVSVSDTGPGLSPAVADRLFQPFVTTKEKGMGIGLSLCRSIIEAHGGQIWTEPRAERGTTFAFTLPLASQGLSQG